MSEQLRLAHKAICRKPVRTQRGLVACNRREEHSGKCKPAARGQRLTIRA